MRSYLIMLSVLLFCFSGTISCVPVAYRVAPSLKPVVVIDPGHGGSDLGARVHSPYGEEKRYTLATALFTKKYLDQLGYRVVLTRYSDLFIPLERRVAVANQRKAELFVSIHFNSCSTPSVQGIEIYYPQVYLGKRIQASAKLAQTVLDKVLLRTKFASRGIKPGNYYVLRETKMPAILIEGGFLTNKTELNRIRTREYQDQLGKGIAEGIDRFIRLY